MRTRRIVRFIWFGVSIVVGIGMGLLIGWSLPVDTANAAPVSLREDYQLDYVLMVAEVYHQDDDLSAALKRLDLLDQGENTVRFVQQATLDAHTLGYSKDDLEWLVALSQAVSTSSVGSSVATP